MLLCKTYEIYNLFTFNIILTVKVYVNIIDHIFFHINHIIIKTLSGCTL